MDVNGTDFMNYCEFTSNYYIIGARKGIVMWHKNIIFAGKTQCKRFSYQNQPCLLPNIHIRCVQDNIVITSMSEPFPCGHKAKFVRIVLINDTATPLLTDASDYVHVTQTFKLLVNRTNTFPNSNATLFIKVYALCEENVQ